MAEINWTVLVYIFIGIFALSGYFRGWWKEAITTVFLSFLVFLLLVPGVAETIIDINNALITWIWSILPDGIIDFFNAAFGAPPGAPRDNPPLLDASSGQTWLIILILTISAAILIARWSLPNSGRGSYPYSVYVVSLGGGIFGGILGAINGWLIVSLVRVYLAGSSLPGNSSVATTPPSEVLVQATDVPQLTILDSYLPWIYMGVALLVLVGAVRSRVGFKTSADGYRKAEIKSPYGYSGVNIKSK